MAKKGALCYKQQQKQQQQQQQQQRTTNNNRILPSTQHVRKHTSSDDFSGPVFLQLGGRERRKRQELWKDAHQVSIRRIAWLGVCTAVAVRFKKTGTEIPLGGDVLSYKTVLRTSAVSSTNFGSILIFASCIVDTCNVLCG